MLSHGDISWHQRFLCRLSLCRELANFNIDLSPFVLDKAKRVSTNRLWIVLWVYCRVKDSGQKIPADDFEASQDSPAQLSKSLMSFGTGWDFISSQKWIFNSLCYSNLDFWPQLWRCLLCVVWQYWEDTNSLVHSKWRVWLPLFSCGGSCNEIFKCFRAARAACPESGVVSSPLVFSKPMRTLSSTIEVHLLILAKLSSFQMFNPEQRIPFLFVDDLWLMLLLFLPDGSTKRGWECLPSRSTGLQSPAVALRRGHHSGRFSSSTVLTSQYKC